MVNISNDSIKLLAKLFYAKVLDSVWYQEFIISYVIKSFEIIFIIILNNSARMRSMKSQAKSKRI